MKWKSIKQRTEYYRKWRANHREELKKYQRGYYGRHYSECRRYDKEYTNNHLKEERARKKFQEAVRIGKIKRQPCILCGKKAEGHHPDYNKPFAVVWLCKSHHKLLHLGKLLLENLERIKT